MKKRKLFETEAASLEVLSKTSLPGQCPWAWLEEIERIENVVQKGSLWHRVLSRLSAALTDFLCSARVEVHREKCFSIQVPSPLCISCFGFDSHRGLPYDYRRQIPAVLVPILELFFSQAPDYFIRMVSSSVVNKLLLSAYYMQRLELSTRSEFVTVLESKMVLNSRKGG